MIPIFRILALLVLALSAMPLHALPAQVIIIRHGEKPPEGNDLDLRGRERAAALAPLFKGDPRVLEHGAPVAIYAMEPDSQDASLRPMQTVEPTAEALDLPLRASYQHDEYPAMAKEILSEPKYDGRMVLICWEHHVIPQIAAALGATGMPKKWHGKVFDRLWVLDFSDDGKVGFRDLPQKLLFGDSAE